MGTFLKFISLFSLKSCDLFSFYFQNGLLGEFLFCNQYWIIKLIFCHWTIFS